MLSGGRQRIACQTANSASGCIGSTYSTMPCCFSRPPQTPTPSGHKSVLHRSFFRHIFPVHQHFACPHLRETSSVVALPWIGATLARGEGLGGLHGQTVREASREAHMHNHSQLIHNSPPPGVHEVLQAVFLLLGNSTKEVSDWMQCKALLSKTGKKSFKTRVHKMLLFLMSPAI